MPTGVSQEKPHRYAKPKVTISYSSKQLLHFGFEGQYYQYHQCELYLILIAERNIKAYMSTRRMVGRGGGAQIPQIMPSCIG